MIANHVSSLRNPTYQFRIFLCSLTDYEKGRARLVPIQNIEQTRSKSWIGAIIKRESGHISLRVHAGNRSHDMPHRKIQNASRECEGTVQLIHESIISSISILHGGQEHYSQAGLES